MADGLNGRTFVAGASISKKRVTFTRDSNDTTDMTGSAVELLLSPDNGDDIILAVGSGLTRVTDTESSQVVEVVVTESQVTTLLGGRKSMGVDYHFSITPSGSEPVRGHQGTAYNGRFTIIAEG